MDPISDTMPARNEWVVTEEFTGYPDRSIPVSLMNLFKKRGVTFSPESRRKTGSPLSMSSL